MKNMFQYLRTHTFSRIILTFISILTVSLAVVGGFSYYVYRLSLIQNAVKSGRTSVEFIMEQIDSEIRNLHYATLSILNNNTLKSFDNYKKYPMPDSQFRLKAMMEEISHLENSYPSLASIWLYSSNSETYITRYGAFDKDLFLSKRTRIERFAGRDLAQIVEEASPFRYFSTCNISDYYGEQSCISFLRSVTDYNEKPVGQIIMNMDSRVFGDAINRAAREDLLILLLDEENQLILSSRGAGALTQNIPQILLELESDSPKSIRANGKQYTGWITSSNESGMRCLSLIDQRVLLQNVDYIRLVTIGLLAACLLVSVILAFSVTNKLFAPIRKIILYIQAEQKNLGGGNYRDAFLIEQFIVYMKSKNDHLQECVDNYTAVMREAMLTELLYSQEQQPVMELYQKVDLSPAFPHERFTVAVIPLAQPGQEGLMKNDRLMEQIKRLLADRPFHESGFDIWLLPQTERLILILNTAEDAGINSVGDFLDQLKSEYENSLLYAYGKTYPSISGLYDSFHQAINILMVKPSASHLEADGYEDAMNAHYITSFYPQEIEMKLMRQIKSRSSGDVPRAILLDIIRRNKEGAAPALRLESLFVQLLMTINRIIAEMGLSGGVIFGKDQNHYRVLESFRTLDEKEGYVLSSFDKLLTCIRSLKPSKVSEIYQTMLDYVADHYAEEMSLNDISYQLDLSPSYLSSIFKECHSTTFLDYLNKYRIAKAKPLLLNTDETVAVIAAKAGYENVNTFIRIFKKEEGVTPGQYRQKH